jgi:hypothetical protein
MQEQKCPKCGSDYCCFNAIHNYAPIEEQFLYTCGDCQHQYGRLMAESANGDKETETRHEKSRNPQR